MSKKLRILLNNDMTLNKNIKYILKQVLIFLKIRYIIIR